MDSALIGWLLEGDPLIRWQVEKDLLDLPEEDWKATQSLIATEGWGARLLAERDEDGRWSRGIYTPKWTSTTYTLLLLVEMITGRYGIGELLIAAQNRFNAEQVYGMVLVTGAIALALAAGVELLEASLARFRRR